MAHHAPHTILILIFTCMHTLHAMKKPDPPEDTPLAKHLEDFKAGKKKRGIPAPTITPPQEPTALCEHLSRFEQGKTAKSVTVLPLPSRVKTLAEQKLEKQALRIAVAENDIKTVKTLLDNGVEPMATNNANQQTTLHLAAKLGHAELVELLLQHPLINKDAINSNHVPPIVYAIEESHSGCLGHFLEKRVWIGPDTEKYTCLHTAILANNLLAVVTLLTHCVDPFTALPDPFVIPVPHDDLNDAALNNPLVQNEIIRQAAQPSSVPSLESLCLQKLLFTHIKISKQLRCDLLSKLWKGALKYKIPASLTSELGPYLDFAAARAFVLSFAPNDHYVIAKELAHYYAARHVIAITRLINTANIHHETPLQMARRLQRSPLMQALVDPVRHISHLAQLLKCIPDLAHNLELHPQQQNAYDLFYHLFVFRLVGHTIVFNPALLKK